MNISISKKDTAGLFLKILIVILVILFFSIINLSFTETFNVNIPDTLSGKIFYNEQLTEIYSFGDSTSGRYTSVETEDELVIKTNINFNYIINHDASTLAITFVKAEDNSRTLTFINNGLLDIPNNKYFIELVD